MSKQNHHSHHNSRNPKEGKLQELLLFLLEIFPKQQTENPFYKIELIEYPSKYAHLHKLLTHFLTLIYQNNRIVENNRYITQREDVLASLQILEIISLQAHRDLNQIAEDCYQKLQNNSKPNQGLSRKIIEVIIQKRKSQTHRIINAMLEKGYLELIGGHKNKGFIYRIIVFKEAEKEQEKALKKEDKPNSKKDIFEGFDDFNDNNYIDYNYKSDNYKKYVKD
jgi:hypothetical protein